ncbi:MAG: hypothetical protein WCV71_01845 [Patescibacteria group bacterium]|jgi:hypothetical protein
MIKKINASFSPRDFLYAHLAMISSLVLPFFLLFSERKLLLAPAIVEESAKVLLIFFLILPIRCLRCRFSVTLFVGIILAFSENIFYLPDFIAENNLVAYFQRFVGPTALHIFTMFFMVTLASWKRYLLWPAFLIAIAIHYYFNFLILS